MSRWTEIKIIISVIVSIFIVLILVLLIDVGYFINSEYEYNINNEQVVSSKQTVDNKLNMDDDFVHIIKIVSEKDGNWSSLPLSKEFRKKYSAKYGILGENDNFTYLSSSKRLSNKDNNIVCLIVMHNLKDEYYYIHYIVNDNNELDDVEIVDRVLKQDEHGNPVIYKKSMTEKNYLHNLKSVAYPPRLEYEVFEYINVTDNYLTKWKNGFVKGDYTFSIQSIDEICDYDKQIAYLKCEYNKYDENGDIADVFNPFDDELTLYYKVKFFTNKDLCLDDVEVEEMSKEEIDRLIDENKN